MTHCERCHEPLDDVAKYAGSPVCAACSFEQGTMRDGDIPDTEQEEAA